MLYRSSSAREQQRRWHHLSALRFLHHLLEVFPAANGGPLWPQSGRVALVRGLRLHALAVTETEAPKATHSTLSSASAPP